MNWKEINEKCPKAFLEWVKDTCHGAFGGEIKRLEYIGDEVEFVALRDNGVFSFRINGFCWGFSSDEARILPFYFDQFGIFVEPYIYDDRRPSKGWKAIVSYNEGDTVMPPVPLAGFSPDRLSATIAGVIKAFEIREQQLNEKQ